MSEEQILWLWGKTCREKNNPEAPNLYHPLLFHLLDVAYSALALWDAFLCDAWKERLARAFGCDVATARLLVGFLAAVHDLGKATPGFQFQPGTPLIWLHKKLREVELSDTKSTQNKPHNYVSTQELKDYWIDDLWVWKSLSLIFANVLSHIVGAHHGTFPDSPNWPKDVLGDENWRQARLALIDILATHLLPAEFVFPESGDWKDLGAIPHLAGFISVADWIGSSDHFQVKGHKNGTMSVAEYLPHSQQCATQAIDDFGFTKAPKWNAIRPTFQQFWGFEPNALQKEIDAVTGDVSEPFLLICEAQMGSGKTEGALWATDAAFSNGVNEGFYIALPTQATSNAMFDRARDYLDKRTVGVPVNLQLAHANAGLSNIPKINFKPLSEIYNDLQNDPEKARVMALSWFNGAKRPLLAPFGVGTIDQSLTATLQTLHYFVRLLGLAGKTVIFDEVHAYDTYMSQLLVTLVHWLKELGCSVILLSATLPSGKRRELLQAWGAQIPPDEANYPRLTWCPATQQVATSIAIEEKSESTDKANSAASEEPDKPNTPQKTVEVYRLHPDQLGAELLKQLKEGGCAAIICNTVGDAQELYRHLKDELEGFVEPEHFIVFHARLPFLWRQARERKSKRLFGKKKSKRPLRSIVISTQVLEQSLDIDFDWMASFMAPTDLLLQRIGRLHRHAIDEFNQPVNRHGLVNPRFAILTGSEGGGPPNFDDSEYVYEREVLLRSWLLWRDKSQLELPAEIETFIEATYQDSPNVPDDVAWQIALKEAGEVASKRRNESTENSKVVVVNCCRNGKYISPASFLNLPSRGLLDEDNPGIHKALRAKTREGDESVTVICLCQVDDKYYLPDSQGNPNLKAPIDLSVEPDRKTVKRLMDCSLPLSQKGLYSPLMAMGAQTTWKKSPFLRHARVLAFKAGAAKVGDKTLELDGELGIVIPKAKKEGEKSNS